MHMTTLSSTCVAALAFLLAGTVCVAGQDGAERAAVDRQQPVVAMSAEHRASCLVYLNQVLPEGRLPDQTGTEHSLRESLGKAVTVVVFWNRDQRYAWDQFRHLQRDLAAWRDKGVRVIAIHVGAPPRDYDALCREHGQGVLCLLDGDGSYFATVATTRLPRTYVLDAQGKIVWLDLEYSRSTRHDLQQALEARTGAAD